MTTLADLKLKPNKYNILRELNDKIHEVCPGFPELEVSVFYEHEELEIGTDGAQMTRAVEHVTNMVSLHNTTFPGQYSTEEFLESFLKFRIQYLQDLKSDMITGIRESALKPTKLELQTNVNKFFTVNSKLFFEANISKRVNLRSKNAFNGNVNREIYEDLTNICNGTITNDNIEDLNIRLYCIYTFYAEYENSVMMNVLRGLEDVNCVLQDEYKCVRSVLKEINPLDLNCPKMYELRSLYSRAIWNSLNTNPNTERTRLIEFFELINVGAIHTSRYEISGMDYAMGSESVRSMGLIQPPYEIQDDLLNYLSPDVQFNNTIQGYTVPQMFMQFALNVGLTKPKNEVSMATFLVDELEIFGKLYK